MLLNRRSQVLMSAKCVGELTLCIAPSSKYQAAQKIFRSIHSKKSSAYVAFANFSSAVKRDVRDMGLAVSVTEVLGLCSVYLFWRFRFLGCILGFGLRCRGFSFCRFRSFLWQCSFAICFVKSRSLENNAWHRDHLLCFLAFALRANRLSF